MKKRYTTDDFWSKQIRTNAKMNFPVRPFETIENEWPTEIGNLKVKEYVDKDNNKGWPIWAENYDGVSWNSLKKRNVTFFTKKINLLKYVDFQALLTKNIFLFSTMKGKIC